MYMYVTRTGNEHLDCFGGDPERVIEEMRQRFGPGIARVYNKQASTIIRIYIVLNILVFIYFYFASLHMCILCLLCTMCLYKHYYMMYYNNAYYVVYVCCM